jgi:hypothetical protein
MNKMKNIIAILMVLILGISILAGCGGDEKITGKFVREHSTGESSYYEFFADGKCVMSTYGVLSDLTFSQKGKNITIEMEYGSFKAVLDGNKLTVNEFGEELVYEKK